jgi:flagella basal body P-ring formation protein FlgA
MKDQDQRDSYPVRFALVLVIIVTMLSIARAAFPSAGEGDPVRRAIAAAVASRIGGDALVTVTTLQADAPAAKSMVAVPEPGARTNTPARFVIFSDGARVGSAVATVFVNASHVRATRAILRDEAFASGDVEQVNAPMRNQLLRRVPALEDVIGNRARRNIAQGEAITAAVVNVQPLVRSGDAVSVLVRIGAVEAEGKGIASGSGHTGDVIRVVNKGSRRPLKARITGPGAVEIIQ